MTLVVQFLSQSKIVYRHEMDLPLVIIMETW